MFDKLQWFADRLVIDDLILRLEHSKSAQWNGPEHLMFYKVDGLIQQYDAFFKAYPNFHPQRVVELGLWDGGSTLFWAEVLKPEKIVGIDHLKRENSRYFKNYVESRGLARRVVTHWGIDQADKTKLREIIASEFDAPIDFVIDDCSHLYGPTKASFEALFPLMSPGGWYIVEDWAWGHWPNFVARKHPWRGEKPLTEFVIELVKCAGGYPDGIASVLVLSGFVAVQRGGGTLDRFMDFPLKRYGKYFVRFSNNPLIQGILLSMYRPRKIASKAKSLVKRIPKGITGDSK